MSERKGKETGRAKRRWIEICRVRDPGFSPKPLRGGTATTSEEYVDVSIGDGVGRDDW